MFQDIEEPPKGAGDQLKMNFWQRLKHWWKGLSRNLRFGIISAALLLFGAAALGYFTLIQPDSQPDVIIGEHHEIPPKTVASPLTGMQVDPALAERPVTGVMIENSLDARPQSGLNEAGVVYEAIAEAGITRFLSLFQESQPQYVGPVRSLRPYYIDWATPFDAGIAHVGGSPEALKQIRSKGKDLDQFFNPGAYWRQSSRAAPHNMYTSFKNLDKLNKSKGYKHSKFTSWERKDDQPLPTPKAVTINVNISSGSYNSSYKYDAKSNTYYRSEGGAKHVQLASPNDKHPKQIHPKVLVALVMPYGIESDGYHSRYNTYGKGVMYVFQDGNVTKGVWHKKNRSSQFSFTDSAGKTIALDAGQTWLVAVGATNQVTWSAPKPAAQSNQ
ncbi:MAG TPA: DUF3048 domain-containing protein [Candidatus Saccharimonadales bacterium]|nr:DUF3048 domain-containing protein [Candidatus Saccharimonadales bacterium]